MRIFNKYFIATIIIPLLAAYTASAQVTLDQCIKRALEANFSITIADNNLEIAKNNVTLAPFLPSVTISSRQSANRQEQRNYTNDGGRESSSSSSSSILNSANLNWRLFDGFSMFATRDKQKELLAQGEYNFRSVAENMVMQVSAQYYLIISLQNQVNLLEELVAISQIRYNQSLTRFNIGSSSGLEYKQAKIYLNSDSSKLLLQKENLKNAYIEIFRLMNVPLDSKSVINDSIIAEPVLDVARLIALANENNTSLAALRAGERIAKLDTRITKSARYPSLDLTAGYSYNLNQSQYFPSRYNESNGLNWGLSFSIPVFDRNEINRKVKNARIYEENANLSYLKAKQDLESELYQLYNVYINNLRLIGFEEENREAAYLNLDAALEKYRLGSLSGIEFRDIQLSYLDASDRRLKAIYQAKISEINLHLLAGELFRQSI
ncbi:MAG: TolC family protein [Bacteroidales bacterium]|jgi:outer membrane protein TolC